MNDNKENNKKKYLRDGRAPIPEKESVSKVMSSNRSRNTKPELILRKELRNHGFPGYRLHWRKASGRPDICYPGRKIAIFVNGCYWHRCPKCNLSIPKTNSNFWINKFEQNVKRDSENIKLLIDKDWSYIVLWECDIKKDLESCLESVLALIRED